jgi:hypothetical protein
VILREARAGAERLLEDGRDDPLGELDERVPGLAVIGTGSDDEGRRARLIQERDQFLDRSRIGGCGSHDTAGGRVFTVLVDLGGPVVHGDDHECRPAPRLRLVVRAFDCPGNVLRSDGLIDPHRIVTGEPGQLAGEKGLEDEVPTILLPDEDDERGPIHTRCRESADGVPEPGRGVEDGKRRFASADREAGREPDDAAFVQSEHEPEVVREPREERNLGRPGVREHRRQPAAAEDVERGVADRHVASTLMPAATKRVHDSEQQCEERDAIQVDRRLPRHVSVADHPRPGRSSGEADAGAAVSVVVAAAARAAEERRRRNDSDAVTLDRFAVDLVSAHRVAVALQECIEIHHYLP